MKSIKDMNNENNIYCTSFSLEEIKPIILSYIDRAQDITSPHCLSRCITYEIYHYPIVEFYKQHKQQKTPSMADKLAFILLLSYPKSMIERFNDISELKLFSDENTDFIFEREYELNDDEDDRHDCICSFEKLKYISIVYNKHNTDVQLQIGSKCIEKYKIISYEELQKFKQAEKIRKERKKEIKEGKPVGFYKEQKRIKKEEKEKIKIEKEKEKEKKKIEKLIKSGNFKICYKCETNLVDIRNNNLCICNKCKIINENIHKSLCLDIKTYNFNSCENCQKKFVDKIKDDPYLCKLCINIKKIVECKTFRCQSLFLVDKNSNEQYCDSCEKTKFKNCIDCGNKFIIQNISENRCTSCDYNYKNKIINIECKSCKDEFLTKDNWRIYCNDCYKTIKDILQNPPVCNCGLKMIGRTIKKDGPNKGRKGLGCANFPNGCGKFDLL